MTLANWLQRTRKAPFIIFFVFATVAVAAQCYSLRFSPTIWQDEIQILDWGRSILPGGDQGYGMSWLESGRPYSFISYIGCAIQELACRISADDPFGPRFSSLIGAVVAAGAMLGWLRQRGLKDWVALSCSLIFLTNGMFAQSYRGGRVDSWAIAFMLLACWAASIARDAIRNPKANPAVKEQTFDVLERGYGLPGSDEFLARCSSARFSERFSLCWFTLSGVCVGISGLIWVSSILLLPLIVCELLFGIGPAKNLISFRSALFGAFVAGCTASVSIVLLLFPVWERVPEMLLDFAEKSPTVLKPRDLFYRLPQLDSLFSLSGAGAAGILGMVGLLVSRQVILIISTIVAVSMVVWTVPYVHRNVYVVPYLIAGMALGADAILRRSLGPHAQRIVKTIFVMCLLWSSALTLGGRSVAAQLGAATRNPMLLSDMAMKHIGPGPHRVYLWNWEFGYVARKLGWKFYKDFPGHNPRSPAFRSRLSDVDHLIVATDEPLAPSVQEMAKLGFSRVVKISPPHAHPNAHLLSRLATARYREYMIYSRQLIISTE